MMTKVFVASAVSAVFIVSAQPLFAQKNFGPYTGYKIHHPDLDYANLSLRNCEAICGGEGGWLLQNLLLGSRQDMDDVVAAFRKVYEHRDELRSAKRGAVGALQ